MIHKVERIGTEDNAEGWFEINDSVQVQYIGDEDGGITMNLNFDDTIITEAEAIELGNELLRKTLNLYKGNE